MWMGERLNRKDESEITAADMGKTSISGEKVAVVSRGELRELEIWSPGGYRWRPRRDDEVLVIKGGTAGEERCVLAMAPEDVEEEIDAGEVCIFSEGAVILLRNDGAVDVKNGSARVKLTDAGVEIQGGSIRLCGAVVVEGSLTINGEPCCVGCCEGG